MSFQEIPMLRSLAKPIHLMGRPEPFQNVLIPRSPVTQTLHALGLLRGRGATPGSRWPFRNHIHNVVGKSHFDMLACCLTTLRHMITSPFGIQANLDSKRCSICSIQKSLDKSPVGRSTLTTLTKSLCCMTVATELYWHHTATHCMGDQLFISFLYMTCLRWLYTLKSWKVGKQCEYFKLPFTASHPICTSHLPLLSGFLHNPQRPISNIQCSRRWAWSIVPLLLPLTTTPPGIGIKITSTARPQILRVKHMLHVQDLHHVM